MFTFLTKGLALSNVMCAMFMQDAQLMMHSPFLRLAKCGIRSAPVCRLWISVLRPCALLTSSTELLLQKHGLSSFTTGLRAAFLHRTGLPMGSRQDENCFKPQQMAYPKDKKQCNTSGHGPIQT